MNSARQPLPIAIIGCGAIGCAVMQALDERAGVRVTQIIVPPASIDEASRDAIRWAPGAMIRSGIDMEFDRPALVVECAGHAALAEHVIPALAAGVPAIVASVGALHDAQRLVDLEQAAGRGGVSVTLASGAIGGIDALAAARLAGLTSVHYTGRKPPGGWRGTPAEGVVDLAALTGPAVVFDGTAREAARQFPQNANVAATVSLAGLGLDETRATLVADPAVTRNVHRLVAEGRFGRFELSIENDPLPANPKTSALTVYSIVRAIRNATGPLVI